MTQEKWKQGTFLCIISFLLLPSIFSGCIDDVNNGEALNQDTIIIGTSANESIYPFSIISNNLLLIFCNIFDGLVEFDEIYGILPDLAESWTNPNVHTWRFNLRQDVVFHNGCKFTAEDVKYSFDSLYINSKPFIKEVNVINNYTVDFITYEPYPNLLQSLGQSFMVLSKNHSETSQDSWPIGTGPYLLAEYVEDDYTRLERFDGYWGDTPKIKTVIVKVIQDKEERIDALINGEIDVAEYNVDDKINEIAEYDGINIVTYPPLSTYIIGFDLRENGSHRFTDGMNPTADVRVRKALYHAIDINPLINGPFQGLAIPASQLLTSYVFGYNPEIKRLRYNVSTAKQLLDDAGYENGFDIEMDCITVGYEYNVENCNLIVQQLAEIGVNVSLNMLSSSEFNQKVVYEKNSSMYLVGWGPMSVDGGFMYNRFLMSEGDYPTGYYNSGHYSNTTVDLLGVEAATEMNQRKRLGLLQEGFKIALSYDTILIPLFSQYLFFFASEEIKWKPRADLRIIFEDFSLIDTN